MFRSLNNEKIGNVLVFFASKLPFLPMTKAIKLLFLLDEKSVKETGVPVTWLDYSAWKMGPVPSALYHELKHGRPERDDGEDYSIADYVDIQRYEESGNTQINIKAKGEFNDQLFCDYEIDLMEEIIIEFGSKTGSELIAITHAENGLWKKVVEANSLDRLFVSGAGKATNHTVDLWSHLDSQTFAAYVAALESNNVYLKLAGRGDGDY
jgi:uncharacterized phage-associated protein